VERGDYLYPRPSARYPRIALFQLIYSSLTDGFRIKLQSERCTNSTFSRIHVLHARLLSTKVLKTFVRVAFYTQYRSGLEGLRRFWSSGTCSQAINRHLRPPEGDPLDASQVVVLRLVLLRDQSSPSASRRWSPRCFTGCGPQACAPEWSAFTFGPEGPKVGFPVLGVLVGTDHPSGALVTQHRSPADRLGDVFEARINLQAHSRRSNPQHKLYIIFLKLIKPRYTMISNPDKLLSTHMQDFLYTTYLHWKFQSLALHGKVNRHIR